MNRGRVLLLAFALLAALAFDIHNLVNNAPLDLGIDFRVFERASNDPAELVYRDHRAPFAYPPTALILMKPLAVLGYWTWIAISALAFALSVAVIAGNRVAALSFLNPGAIKGLVQGQSPMLLGALLFAGLSLPPLLGGALWGVAASVKPQLMVFAPLALIVRRDWTMLMGMALGGLLMVAASLIFLDLSLWWDWIGAMTNFNGLVSNGAMIRAVTPAGTAAVAGLPMLPFILSGVALGTAAVIVSVPKVEGEQLILLVVAASLVASPYAHSYDTIALIPSCAALLLKGRWIYAVPAAFIFVGTPFLTMASIMALLVMAIAESRSLPWQSRPRGTSHAEAEAQIGR